MKKKFISLLLLLCIVLSSVPVSALAAEGDAPEPCTMTEGCTLEAGHEGDCVLSDDPETLENNGGADNDGTDSVIGPTISEVQAMIDALPDAETITEANAEDVAAQLETIHTEILKLKGEPTELLTLDKYNAAAVALGTLAGKAPEGGEPTPVSENTDEDTGTTISVASQDDLVGAFETINGSTSAEWTISLSADITLEGTATPDLDVVTGKTVTLLGNGHTITYGSDTKSAQAPLTLCAKGGTLNLGASDGNNTLTITANNTLDHADPLIKVLGGGIVNMYKGVTLTGNTCTSSNAGGVDIQAGTFNMYGGTISHCESLFGYGGAVWVNGSTGTSAFNMYGGLITENKATGFYMSGKSYGGGVCVSSGATFTMSGGTITQNTSNSYGGGVCVYAATATITGGSISENACNTGYGGGICNYYGTVTVSGCSIEKNTAMYGGGVAAYAVNYSTNYPGSMSLEKCTIQDNEAGDGGGIFSAFSNNVSFASCSIKNNTSTDWGGGIYAYKGSMTLNNNTELSSNGALVGGGLLVDGGAEVTLTNATVQTNRASSGKDDESPSGIGGGVAVVSGSLDASAQGNIICNNTADTAAADVYAAGAGSSSTTSIQLPDAATMNQVYAADNSKKEIDGWYSDPDDPRYQPNENGQAVDVTAALTDEQCLVAAYKPEITCTVTIQYVNDEDGKPVVGAPDKTVLVEKNSSYDVTNEMKQGIPTSWAYDCLAENSAPLTGTAESDKTVIVVLAKDVWDDEDNNLTDGDGIPDKYQVVIQYEAGANGSVSGETIKVLTLTNETGVYIKSKTITPGTEGVTVTANGGYRFNTWTPDPAAAITVIGGTIYTYTASFSKSGGGGGGTTYYTLHYESNGGTEYKDERYASGTTVKLDKTPTREGYVFTCWYADEALTEKITSIKMTSDKTVYAGWRASTVPDMLDGDDHFAYVIGYSDGTVRPNANISRAEVATIFFRLLKADIRDSNLTGSNTFGDVQSGMWCNTAISSMARLGIVKGRSAEIFDPDAPITRAEFAAICARFDTGNTSGKSDFTDISGHWAEAEIERAASLGWIRGYADGTFRPDQYITRAEVMTMINRVLCRIPEDESDLLTGMNVWPDNQPNDWYYLAVQEATNSHDWRQKGEIYESWIDLTAAPDWTRYQG